MTKYCCEAKYFCVNLLDPYLVFFYSFTTILRTPMSWIFNAAINFHPVFKDDNWCQSWLEFPDLNSDFDNITQRDLMLPIYFIFLLGLTIYIEIYKITRYKFIIYIYIYRLKVLIFKSELFLFHPKFLNCI